MSLNRRSFLKIAGAGAALGIINPNIVLAAPSKGGKNANMPKYETLKFDVAVVGAGAAGIPAAISAAREGAKVVLIEEDQQPGGAPVDMYITFICGAPRVGIYNNLVQELNAKHTLSGKPVETFGRYGMDGKNHWWHPTAYLMVLNKFMRQEKNLTLMCGAPVVETLVSTKGNRNIVRGVRIMRNGVLQDIEASVVIDATGSGLVSSQAGCEYMYGRESMRDFNENIGLEVTDGKVQPCTWMIMSQRIRKDAVLPRHKLKGGVVEDNLNKWVMPNEMDEMIKRDAGIYLHWGTTVHCKNTLDTVALANAQRECLEKIQPDIEAMEEAGFAVYVAPKMGVREARRIKGEYVLSATDLQQGKMPDDKVADAWYDLDPWGMKLTKEQKQVPPYGIPYRSLIPLNTEGLLTAGRIISGTHIAASSYRVQPICSSIGEAAGVAAAMTVLNKTKVRDIDVKKLIQRLDEKGMFEGLRNKQN